MGEMECFLAYIKQTKSNLSAWFIYHIKYTDRGYDADKFKIAAILLCLSSQRNLYFRRCSLKTLKLS